MFRRFTTLCWSYMKTGALGMAVFAILALAYGGIRFAPARISVVTYAALLALTALATFHLTMVTSLLRDLVAAPLRTRAFPLRGILRSWWQGPSVSHKTAH